MLVYGDFSLINFINLEKEELKLILEWRNNKKVRKWMLNKNEITLIEHFNYIETLKDNENKLCLLVKEKKEYIGIIEFNKIDFENRTADFGININVDKRGNGLGRKLINLAFLVAKKELKLSKLKLSVFKENERALNLYKKNGFILIKKSMVQGKQFIYMEREI